MIILFQFVITSLFWFFPSLFWKTSLLADPAKDENSLEFLPNSEDRILGVVAAVENTGVDDIYNRVLCPTCIVQIIFINTMLVSMDS